MIKKSSEGAAVSDFLYRIYGMQDVASLVRVICDGLLDVVPGENVAVARCHKNRRALSAMCSMRPFGHVQFLPDIVRSELLASHPFWDVALNRRYPVKSVSDFLSARAWREHPYYCEFIKSDGMQDHIEIEVGVSGQDYTTIDVLRTTRGFSERDRTALLMLKPHLEQAFRNARRVESLAPHVTSDSGPTTSILRVRCDGSLEDVPFRAARSNPVPKPVQRWIVEQVGWMNRGVADVVIPAYLWEDGKIRAEYRLSRQWGSEGYILSFRLLKDTPPKHLTAREQEVIHWVSEGKSNPEIAIILGISPHTIKDHLKQIYQKLEVENRTSAVRVWRDSASSTL